MRRAARVDANQKAIVRALRQAGATVQHLHTIGQGCPDLLVGFREDTFLLEVKTKRGKLTSDEADWHLMWRGSVVWIVRCVEDALAAIGVKLA